MALASYLHMSMYMQTSQRMVMSHPILIECVCNSTLATDAIVSTTIKKSNQPAQLVLPDCIDDVFGETGVRWYLNGPLNGGITYWARDPYENAIA